MNYVCTVCDKPVFDGQARYGANGNHYECERPRIEAITKRFDIDGLSKRIDASFEQLKKAVHDYDERNKRNGRRRR